MNGRERVNQVMVKVTDALGSLPAVLVAMGLVVVWALSRSLWADDDAWMLVINTATTIVTFIVGFVILFTSKSQSRATQVKLDALLLATGEPRGQEAIGIDDRPDQEIRAEQQVLREDAPEGATSPDRT